MQFISLSFITAVCIICITHMCCIRPTELKPLLTPETVTELVMATMKNLPPKQPRTFRSSYTPIAAAGTDAQVTEHLLHIHVHIHVAK